jgi:hypothetical protein
MKPLTLDFIFCTGVWRKKWYWICEIFMLALKETAVIHHIYGTSQFHRFPEAACFDLIIWNRN